MLNGNGFMSGNGFMGAKWCNQWYSSCKVFDSVMGGVMGIEKS